MAARAFALLDIAVPAFDLAVRLSVEAGLDAAAILDAKGKPLAVAGALDNDEARALAAHATHQARSAGLLDRMLRGELIETSLGERGVRIGIAASCVWFVVVFPLHRATASHVAVEELRSDIEEMVHDARSGGTKFQPPPTSSGGSSSGPAELPVVEVGVTARRKSSKRPSS